MNGSHENVAQKALGLLKNRMAQFDEQQGISRFSLDGVLYEVRSFFGQDILQVIAPTTPTTNPASPITDITTSFVENVQQFSDRLFHNFYLEVTPNIEYELKSEFEFSLYADSANTQQYFQEKWESLKVGFEGLPIGPLSLNVGAVVPDLVIPYMFSPAQPVAEDTLVNDGLCIIEKVEDMWEIPFADSERWLTSPHTFGEGLEFPYREQIANDLAQGYDKWSSGGALPLASAFFAIEDDHIAANGSGEHGPNSSAPVMNSYLDNEVLTAPMKKMVMYTSDHQTSENSAGIRSEIIWIENRLPGGEYFQRIEDVKPFAAVPAWVDRPGLFDAFPSYRIWHNTSITENVEECIEEMTKAIAAESIALGQVRISESYTQDLKYDVSVEIKQNE